MRANLGCCSVNDPPPRRAALSRQIVDLRVHFHLSIIWTHDYSTTPLSGHAALVTGSTGGLGVGIAHALAHAGAFVVVTGRDKARGDAVVADIRSAGGSAAFASADLSGDDDEVRRLASFATELAGGRLDILVNNAAMLLMPTPTADVPIELLREAFSVNVFAPFLLTV